MTEITNFYRQKCESCSKERPDKSIPVFYDQGQA